MEPWEYPDHWKNYTFTYSPHGRVIAMCEFNFAIINGWLKEFEELDS